MRNYILTDGSWTKEEMRRFWDGDVVDRNGKRYRLCFNCRQIVRVDKPIVGDLHICDPEDK